MTDDTTAGQENANRPNQNQGGLQTVHVPILAQYVKDLSFECPDAVNVLEKLRSAPAEAKVSVDVRANRVEARVKTFELLLTLTVNVSVGGEPAFLVEVQYGGICPTGSRPESVPRPILFVEVPQLLFPFARAVIADTISNAGFPAVPIQMVDFAALAQQRIDENKARQSE